MAFAPNEVPAHIVAHWNSGRMSLERNKALQGAFSAHVWARRALLHAGDAGGIVEVIASCTGHAL